MAAPDAVAAAAVLAEGAAVTMPHPTIAGILAAWERLKPNPVIVFCRWDDADWVTAACDQLPWPVKVAPSEVVPAGQLYIWRGPEL